MLFGYLVQKGCVGKVSNDLFFGGSDLHSLFENWAEVLQILDKNGLRLKAVKTFIALSQAQLLSSDWCNGTIMASSNRGPQINSYLW